MRGSMISRVSTILNSISLSEEISKGGRRLLLAIVLTANSVFAQSLFLGGEYTQGNRAAAMSAYVADPDYAHAVTLNPGKLGYAGNVYVAGDYQYFSRDVGELFLSPSTQYFSNGILSTWNFSLCVPAGPIGTGAAFSAFDLAGWRTTVSSLGLAVRLPFGFSVGAAGKYLTLRKEVLIPGGVDDWNMHGFTFDVGVMNRTVLADNTFFRAILSTGAVFTNALASQRWNGPGSYPPGFNTGIALPQSIGCGVAYTFASNYRLADFELFRVTGAMDYSHVFQGSLPVDDLIAHHDEYRIGMETMALGILAVRIGYTLKTPMIDRFDQANNLMISRAGSGFSYGFSLRFPVKLVLPSLPVASLELSYAKNPEWSSGMYHDLFGVVAEILF